jgi:electron transport complex protein RnfG
MNLETKMIVVLGLIGIISGGILALTYVSAVPLIEENQRRATAEAVSSVLPDAEDYKEVEIDRSTTYFVGERDGEAVGYAVLNEGSGYQGKIRIMVGFSADLKSITGLEVLENSETPGLGNRIVQAGFRDQFKSAVPDPTIVCVKGAKSTQSEIEAITGATISSKAVTSILNDGLEKLRGALADQESSPAETDSP